MDAEASPKPEDDRLAELRALPIAKGCWRLAVMVLTERGRKNDAQARALIGKLKGAGLTEEELWQIAESAWTNGTEDPIPYLTAAADRVIAERSLVGVAAPSEARQVAWMEDFRAGGDWKPGDRGPRPGQIGCRVSDQIQRRFGVEPAPKEFA